MDQKGVLEEQLRKELKECSKLNEIKNSEIIDLTSSHEIKQAVSAKFNITIIK